MREQHWLLRMLDRLARRRRAAVREVDRDPVRVQFAQHVQPIARQSAVGWLQAAGPDQVLVHVGQLDDPHAERVEDLDEKELVVQRRRVLQPVDDADAVLALGVQDVLRAADRPYNVRVLGQRALPVGNGADGLLEALIDRNCDVHSRDTGVAHAKESLARLYTHVDALDEDGVAVQLGGGHVVASPGVRSTGFRSQPVFERISCMLSEECAAMNSRSE